MRAKTLILSLLICAASKAQITLENTYPANATPGGVQVIELVKYGYKYQFTDPKTGTVKLYNLNHSIFKTIPISIPSGMSLYSYPQVTDSLFDVDNLLEVAYSTWTLNSSSTPATFQYETKVIKENGTVLITIPQGVIPQIAYTGKTGGYKMMVGVDSTNKASLKESRIYSLPGGLPVHCCSAGGVGVETGMKQTPGLDYLSGPVPNPSSGKVIIGYQLPIGETTGTIVIYDIQGKELKSYQVDSSFSTLELDNSDLAPGTYFYQLSGSASAKKMVIIK